MLAPALTATPPDAARRLVLTGLGTASPRVRHALARALPLPEAEVARRIFQAPSELLGGLSAELAGALADALSELGLEVAVLEPEVHFEPGRGELEVALGAIEISRLPEVVALVADTLSLDVAAASSLIFAAPAALIGGLSAGVAESLRARFAARGAELLISRPSSARYDVFSLEDARRAEIVRALQQIGVPTLVAGPLVACDLDHPTAARAWERCVRTRLPVRVCDRDLLRYDVWLCRALDTPALRAALMLHCSIPEKVVDRALSRLPLLVARDRTLAQAGALLEALAPSGEVEARLATFQTFDIVIERVGDRALAEEALSACLGGAPPALARLPHTLSGPWPPLQARWLQHGLRAAGAVARLELR